MIFNMVDGKPTWKNDCDFCGACANWCPSASISMKGDLAPSRAHNPDVKVADFYLRREIPRGLSHTALCGRTRRT